MKVKEFIEFVNNAIDTVPAKIESDEDYYSDHCTGAFFRLAQRKKAKRRNPEPEGSETCHSGSH